MHTLTTPSVHYQNHSCNGRDSLGQRPIWLVFWLLGLFWGLASLTAAQTPTTSFDLQGHRGARGLAPENTLAAFERALKIGVSTLELDIGVTKDGVVVVSHDPQLNPLITRNAAGEFLGSKGPLIKSSTLAELQSYDVGRIQPGTPYAAQFAEQQAQDGQRIPALAAVFDLVKKSGLNTVRLNIETKINPLEAANTASPEAMTDALLAAINSAGMASRVTVQSFDWRTLKQVQQKAPSIATSCLTFQSSQANTLNGTAWTAGLALSDFAGVPELVKAAGCSAWSPNFAALSQPQVASAKALGLQVLPWTVNERTDMTRLIGWGVSGIVTDYPDRLRGVMGELGMALPQGQ